MKLVTAELSPAPHFIESDFTDCLQGEFHVLMVADLNAKNVDSGSRLIRTGDSLEHGYNRKVCLIYEPDLRTMVYYIHSSTSGVFDIMVVKNIVLRYL